MPAAIFQALHRGFFLGQPALERRGADTELRSDLCGRRQHGSMRQRGAKNGAHTFGKRGGLRLLGGQIEGKDLQQLIEFSGAADHGLTQIRG